jgi:hypothetical protein
MRKRGIFRERIIFIPGYNVMWCCGYLDKHVTTRRHIREVFWWIVQFVLSTHQYITEVFWWTGLLFKYTSLHPRSGLVDTYWTSHRHISDFGLVGRFLNTHRYIPEVPPPPWFCRKSGRVRHSSFLIASILYWISAWRWTVLWECRVLLSYLRQLLGWKFASFTIHRTNNS